MSSQGCWLGLSLLLTTAAGGLVGPGSLEMTPHRVKRGFTYPGTLWCGAGNNAESYEELGEYEETDRCCRDHDQCQHVIHPFTAAYGHHNFRWHTISHCNCDTRLKQCLRQVNDAASRAVGQAFFNVIQVPCFELTYEEQCVERYWYGWCKSYGPMPRAVLHDPVLYEFGGEVTHTSPPPGRTITPGLGAATLTRRVQESPLQPAAWAGQGPRKGKNKGKKKRRKGLPLSPGPSPEPQLVKGLQESRTPGPRVEAAVALDWGSKDDGFNDVLHEGLTEPTPEKTAVKATVQPKKGRRKGHRRRKEHREGAAPSSSPSLS